MITIITTIGQHPKGKDLHIQNLRWIFSGLDYKIYLQTFSSYGFESEDDIEIIEYDADPTKWFDFYGNLDLDLDESEVFFFTQQDNIHVQKLNEHVQKCQAGTIMLSHEDVLKFLPGFHDPSYYCLFDKESQLAYPRVSEISCFIPREIMVEFKQNNLLLESRYGPVSDQFMEKYADTTKTHQIWERRFWDLESFCTTKRWQDTFFQPMVHCCHHKKSWEYIKDSLCHFRSVEFIHREIPKVYESPKWLVKLGEPSYACFLYLLSDVYEPSEMLGRILNLGVDNNLKSMLEMIDPTAHLWMNSRQLEKLAWVNEVISPRT